MAKVSSCYADYKGQVVLYENAPSTLVASTRSQRGVQFRFRVQRPVLLHKSEEHADRGEVVHLGVA